MAERRHIRVSEYGGHEAFQDAFIRFGADERLSRIFGPAEIRKEASWVKKLWHYGVDREDGLVGYDTLRRSDNPAKAAAQGRSPAGLTDDAKEQGYDR